MSEKTYCQTNRDVILNREKYYYENKKGFRECARDKYKNLSEEGENMEKTDTIICLKKKTD